ncbi:MAG TPA: transglutaminase-like domain-containing protein [Candidatus Agrococcus pullicola]|uniref:Transglutaminase-like domain-containing protein n=1 Tax=Candidatus Agrococcus pullicola TaxID=2838429 RepID=A0A9D2CAE8_9MICO|nr:transglutaminase-like domain-containing protein [Candidatus Agrococcus pullicola]
MISGRLAAASFYCIALAAATAMGYSIYATPQFWVATGVTMIAGALLAGAAYLRRWSALTQVGLTVAVLVVLAIPLAAPNTARGSGSAFETIVSVYTAIWTSWRRITTIDLPVGTDDGLLMAPIVLVLVSTVLGAGMILRTKHGELAMLMPLSVMFWALLWGPPVPAPLLLTIGFAIAVVASVASLRQARRRRRADRTVSSLPVRLVYGAFATLLAVSVGVGAATVASLGDRVVLREHPPLPRDSLQAASPLAEFRSNFQDPTRDQVLMTVTGVEDGDLISIASLSVYTGEVFAADTSRLIRTSGRATGEHADRQLGFTIQGYEGVWLPSVGEPESIAFAGPRSSDLSQSLMMADEGATTVALAGLREGDGYSLTVDSQDETPPISDLEPAGSVDRGNQLPLSALDWIAARSTIDQSPGESLQLLIDALEEEGYLSHGVEEDEPPSRAGHSSSRLDALFSAEFLVGDQEQFAAAAALMARELGFPSRVAVGFKPSDEGTVDIYGRDATAWVEILTDHGWVSIEVVPENTAPPESQDSAGLPSTQPQPPVPPALPEGGQPDSQQSGAQPSPVTDDATADPVWLAWTLRALGLLMLLALPFLIIVLMKFLRRRSRQFGGSTRDRAIGAWAEFTDAMIDRGAAAMGERTRLEYAEGDTRVEAFALAVDRAVFSREEPAEDLARGIWRQRDALVSDHDGTRSWWQRAQHRFSLRSLFGKPRRRAESHEWKRAQQEESVHSAGN